MLPTIRWYDLLRQHGTEFDVICEFDLQPFRKPGLDLQFEGRTVQSAHKPTQRFLDAQTKLVRLQATLPEKGVRVYRLLAYSETFLHSYISMQSQVRVLAMRTKGGIGDIIMTLPVLEAIKKYYPHYVVDYACPDEFLPLLKNNPFTQNLFSVGAGNPNNYEITLDMTRECIQYEGRTMPDVKLNRSEIFGKLAGIKPADMPRTKLFLSDPQIHAGHHIDFKRSAQESRLLEFDGLSNKQMVIGICLLSSSSVRSYPHGEELIENLLIEYPDALLCLFQKVDKVNFNHDRLLKFTDFSFADLMTIINRCDLFVGPDTGLTHIASSLRVPTIWLFTHIDGKVRTRGYDTSSIVQRTPPPCELSDPCWYQFPCDPERTQREVEGAPPCAMALSPEMVMNKVRGVLDTPHLSILVVCHNQFGLTMDCIDRILATRKFNDEVILIDNGSTDDTEKHFTIMDREEHLFFYHRELTNTGCVLARNAAIEKARGQFVWILDNDQLISYFSLDRIKQTEGDLVGVEGWWINHQGLADRSSKIGAMNYVGAGGLFAKRKVLMQLGRFDEKYSPAWFEDPDLSFKATEAGFSLGLCENSGIEHLAHSTNHSQTDFNSAKIWKRNRDYFVKKWQTIFSAKPTVSIVILTHNDSDVTKRCIDRIYQTTELKDIEIVVVENGSDKEERDKIAEYSMRPNMKMHYANENLMVAKGRNLGADLASGDHILFLDNDMFLPEGWLPPLLSTLDENNVVATSPTVIDHRPDGKHVRFVATSIKDGRIHEHSNQEKKVECDFLPGGSLFVKSNLFKQYPFDENFVFGVEDYDWCLTVRQAGFKFMNTPEIIFLHVKKSRRTITPYDDAERKRKGSSFIEDSIRLFLYRHEKQLPNQWKEPGWLSWAVGKDNDPRVQSTVDFFCFLHEQVADRYPEEIRVP